ncbi:MAG TPA: hypothetical protein VH396_08005 [Chitinophagaceae bacterium]|jgi:hypothetical protein
MPGLQKLLLCFILCGGIFALPACEQPVYPTPAVYDLNHPIKINLPSELDEISGIIYYAKDTSIFAISDATGGLYKIYPNKKISVKKWRFGKNADYEDVQLVDSTFYILSSSGNIVSLKFYHHDSLEVKHFDFPDKGKNEFETLYFDKTSGQLNLICKDCKSDNKDYVSVWSFDPSAQHYTPASFVIDAKSISKQMNLKKIKFKPSAAAINPLTNDLFILSSINKALVIAAKNGIVKRVYPLAPSLYQQPEGIAFTSSGDLLISNEASKERPADILVIKLKSKAR